MKTERKHRRISAAAIAMVLFFLFLLLFGALVLRYGLGMSLQEKYLRGPTQSFTVQYPDVHS